MILDCPERFGGVTDAHHNPAVFGSVIGPGQLFEFRTIENVDVKGVISNGFDDADALEQVFASVVYLGNKTVLDDLEPLEAGPKLDAKALVTETNAEDGGEQIVWQSPEILDDTNIPGIFGRTWTRTNDYRGEMGEMGDELLDRELVVLDDVDFTVRDGRSA